MKTMLFLKFTHTSNPKGIVRSLHNATIHSGHAHRAKRIPRFGLSVPDMTFLDWLKPKEKGPPRIIV